MHKKRNGNLQSEKKYVTYETLLFRLPKKNSTRPVTAQAALNKTCSSRSGKEAGMTAYPSSGIAPNAAKEQNMITPTHQSICC